MDVEQIRQAEARDRKRVWVLAGALAAAAASVLIPQGGLSDGPVLGGLLAVVASLVAVGTLITRGITEETEHEVALRLGAEEARHVDSDEDSTLFYELMDAAPGEVLDAFDLAVLLQDELRDPHIGEADVTRWAFLGYRVTPQEVIRLRAVVVGRNVYAQKADALQFADTVLRAEAWSRPRTGR